MNPVAETVTASVRGPADLKPLTSLRFVAALMVFFRHFPPTDAFTERYFVGAAGLGFFFLLSGFILAHTYHRYFTDGIAWDRVRSFYVARVARIYPVYIVTTILGIFSVAIFRPEMWAGTDLRTRGVELLREVFLIQAWGHYDARARIWLWSPDIAAANPPAWTISAEAFFYLMFPLAVWWVLRALKEAGPLKIYAVAAAVWLFPTAIFAFSHGAGTWALYSFPPLRFIDFFVGIVIAVAFLHGSTARPRFATLFETGSVAAIVVALGCIPLVPQSLRYALFMMPFWAIAISLFARQQGALSQALSHPWMIRLGEASFAFYMIHYIVLVVENRVFGWSNVAASLVIGLGVSLGLSFALFHWVETPMRRWIRGRFRGYEAPARGPSRRVADPSATPG